MKKVIHRAENRGHANHGWLDSHHSFSFAGFYNPELIHFGNLRVLNDDIVLAQRGFGQHPHADMEIISIPLEGELTHRDTMGHAQVIRTNDVQVMSAGTGLQHSEFNEHPTDSVNFLQLWIFPEEKGLEPRYDQKSYPPENRKNKWQSLVVPKTAAEDGELWINQSAYLSRVDLSEGQTATYKLKKEGNGVYFFLLKGAIDVAGEELKRRDALGLYEIDEIEIAASQDAELLAIEVPMELPSY